MTQRTKPTLVLLFLFCLLYSSYTKAQESIEYYSKTIQHHWICYSGKLGETQTYILYESPLTETVDLHQRNSGFAFKQDNTYLHYLFKMCGNDDSPSYYTGTWNIKKVNNQLVLYMSEVYGEIKNFVLLELTDEKMVLILKK
jgi:hypothetical protein